MADEPEGGGGKGLLAAFKGDKAKWIGVAIAAASLIVAYLIYKRGQAQSQASASSVFPVAGSGVTNPTGAAPDLASQLGNLIGMISAQNQQTQQEIAALTSQQAQQQTPTPTPTATTSPDNTKHPTPLPWVGMLRGNVNPETGQPFSFINPIPVYSSPAGNAYSGTTLPENSWVSITGPQVMGSYPGGTRAYDPISGPGGSTEFVLAQDVTSMVRGPLPGVQASTGKGGPEGVYTGAHMLAVPSGFTQHEFAPSSQVAALRGGRAPARLI